MLMSWLRRWRGRAYRGWLRVWYRLVLLPGWAAKMTFSLVCWLIVLVLLSGIALQVLHVGGPTDAKVLGALLAGLLPAAFLGAYGKDVANRIKKFGPVELFEVREGATYLRDVSLKYWEFGQDVVDTDEPPIVASGSKAFPERLQFFFERADRYLNFLEYSGSEPASGRLQEEHFELLLKVARGAIAKREWKKAIYWCEHLEKLSHRSFFPEKIDNYIATSCVSSVLAQQQGMDEERSVPRKERRDLLVNAEKRLSSLARENELDFQGYFWLAYVQDEVGRWFEAVQSNEAALKRRPRYAPAKYNAVVSLAKLGEYSQAYDMLEHIEPADDFARNVLEAALKDVELRAAVKEAHWQRKMRYLIRRTLARIPTEAQGTPS